MASPTRIRALFIRQAGASPKHFIEYIEIEPVPPTLHAPGGTGPYSQEAENIRRTHVSCCNDMDPSDRTLFTLPLPNVQPKCPGAWNAELWDKRYVMGNTRFHIFFPSESLGESFILKVSDTLDSNKRRFYEDFDFETSYDELKILGARLAYCKYDETAPELEIFLKARKRRPWWKGIKWH